MSDIYVNSPMWMRPTLPLETVTVGQRVVKGKKEDIKEVRSYVTERIDGEEFRRSTFIIQQGQEDADAFGYVADLWDMVETQVPWARGAFGPTLWVKDALGKGRRVMSFVADAAEQIEDSAFLHRITTIAVSTAQPRAAAIKATLATNWRELETEAINAYGPEWAAAIDVSLNEVQAVIMVDENASEAARRADAFVTFALNTLNGDFGDRTEETPFAFQVFMEALSGELGRKLADHRNGFM